MAELRGDRVRLRPIDPADTPALRAILATPEVARWWPPHEAAFPFGDEPDATRFAVVIDGEVAGLVQYSEEPEPDYRHAEIDIFLGPRHHGRGLGTETIQVLACHLIEERGHHRLTICPAAENAVAIRCYEKAGFRRVGVTRSSWRDHARGEWRDELFMELVRLPGKPPPQ